MNPREAQCQGKHPYPTKLAALKVVKRIHRQKVTRSSCEKPVLVAYRCQYCAAYHVGRKKL